MKSDLQHTMRDNLINRGFDVENRTCVLCESGNESLSQLFF